MKRSWSAVAAVALALAVPAARLAAQTPSTPTPTPTPDATPAPAAATPALPAQPQAPPVQAPATAPNGLVQPTRDAGGVYTVRSNVPLVVLDVVVTDSKGVPIKDLTRTDFHVEENAEPQSILDFEPTGAHALPPATSIGSTSELDRVAPRAPVQIIVLDEFNTRFEDMAFARYSLKKFLKRQPELTTPTMLVAVDLQHFTVVHDYTQNKEEIIKALDHHFAAYPWQTHQFAWVAERYQTAFITLRRVAQASVGHPGHKNMIWIGRGFPPFNFFNAPIDAQNRIENAVQECVNVLRDARITLYTIDPAGVMIDPGKYGNAAAFNDPLGGNYQFGRLATATGGAALYGRNDVDAEIGTAIQDGTSFYTLTYRPTNSSRDPRKFRKISVTLGRPGLKVLTREGYYLQYGPGRVDPKNPSRRLMGDLVAADTSTMAYDGVPIDVTPAPDTPGKFNIHIDAKGLSWSLPTDTDPRHADFILVVSTFDKKGVELKRDARIFKVPATGADVPRSGRLERSVDVHYTVEPNPKAVRARFTVRVTASGRIGATDAPLVAGK